jgi:hypothetical protein
MPLLKCVARPGSGNLCKLFGRTTEWNIGIYVLSVIIITIVGSLWIYGETRKTQEERDEWKSRSYMILIIGIILVSFTMGLNLIFYEIAFNEKCCRLENFIDDQIDKLKLKLSGENLLKETSRIAAEGISNELKKELKGTFIKSFLKGIAPQSAVGDDGLSLTKLLEVMKPSTKSPTLSRR